MRSRGDNTLKIIGLVFGIIGLGLLTGSGVLYKNTRGFIDRAVTASGVVTRLETRTSTSRDNDGYTRTSTTYAPVVRFTTPEQKTIEFTSSLSQSPAGYAAGDRVTVLYAPRKPQEAEIRSFAALWFSSLVLLGLGLVFTGVGALLLYLHRRAGREGSRSLLPT